MAAWTGTLDEVEYATTFITPGKNDDGWWKSEHLLTQFKTKAIPMFERLHSNSVAAFMLTTVPTTAPLLTTL
jgi:hypothetical protein